VHGFYSVSRYSAVMTRGERVIAVSESVRRYVLENYPATPPGLIRVIPRGIDPSRYHQSGQPDAAWLRQWHAAHPELRGKCLLLLPGRITRLKGHEDFFRLISALNQQGIPAHGLIAGDTHPRKRSYLSELHGLVGQLGLGEQVTFLGQRSDLREVMAVSDIVCALSQQPEAFGRTVLEALAIGKPVAGYDCGGVGELLAGLFPHGRVPPGDHPRLVQAVASILRERPSPGPVEHPYTLDAMCSATLAVYQELAAPSR
jgi:glycosyltransferase involved in cell wall biosynthesis